MPLVRAGIVIRNPWDLIPAAVVYLDVTVVRFCGRPFEYLLVMLISSVQVLHNTKFRLLEQEAERLGKREVG